MDNTASQVNNRFHGNVFLEIGWKRKQARETEEKTEEKKYLDHGGKADIKLLNFFI
jgi:hypothetical protein